MKPAAVLTWCYAGTLDAEPRDLTPTSGIANVIKNENIGQIDV